MGHLELMEETMSDLGRRPTGRLSCWLIVVMVLSFGRMAFSAPGPQSGAGTTTVADTVYLADGSAAQGNLLISWPAFETASGTEVAAGTTSTALGAGGALSVALVPNVGASPAGAYYTVVYQLGPGEVKTEYWVVPTTSPANLAAVRTTPGSGIASAPVSMQYVNSELATKANDNAVVHLNTAETITGLKTFSTPPNVPVPVNTGDVANKAYVDQSVSNVGAGNYLPTAGGTMSGPITLPADPSAPMQATTKEYVDTGLAARAGLVAGLIPAAELGTGTASTGSCLLGNGSSGTWGTCGGGAGSGNLSTNPAASQSIAQPAGTQFSTNNLANIRYVTPSWNWTQSPADNLATPGSATIHLTPCPLGVDTSANAYYAYKVRIAGTGTAEVALVTGGTCTPGAANGTITVTTVNAHSAGYTVGSASSGIQEAWNDAWVNDTGAAPNANSQTGPYVKLVADTQYNIYSAVYLRGIGGILDGEGALIECATRDRCILVGTTQNASYIHYHQLESLSMGSTISVDGAQVANVSASSGTYTITTAAAHNFVVGDTVDCEYYSQNQNNHWVLPVLTATSNTFTANMGNGTFATSPYTFGFCNILNAAIQDNSDHVKIDRLSIFQSNPVGLGKFSYGVVNNNDQELQITHMTNRSSMVLENTGNFPNGAMIYQRGDGGNAGITYIHNSEFTNVNCFTGGVNGAVIEDSVCQAYPVYGIRYFGGLQPLTIQNVYQEANVSMVNPLYGYAASMGYLLGQGGFGNKIVGSWPSAGWVANFPCPSGSSTLARTYFVVPHSSVNGYGPVLFAGTSAGTACSSSGNITVQWPSIQGTSGTITYDVLVTTGNTTPPYASGMYLVASSTGTCGTNGICSYTDSQAAPTAYTVPSQGFSVAFWFWPVTYAIGNQSILLADEVADGVTIVSSNGAAGPSIIASQCRSGGIASQISPIWISCLTSDALNGGGTIANVVQQGSPAVNSKGVLNFGKPINAPNDIITVGDSSFSLTTATAGHRPANGAGDMAIGVDQSGGYAVRAPTSISNYINVQPSGTNYEERLTAAAKTFNVPVTVNGNLSVTSGTVTLPVTGTGSQCLHASSTGVVSGTGADCGSGGGGSGTVSNGVTSQVAMYSGSGTTVSGDSSLTDNGTTLNYLGTGGIATTTGTFSGNLTVNGQLQVAGPWVVGSPIPGTAMAAAGTGTSSLGISNDGNFYVSANGGAPLKVATSATSSYFSNLFQEDANDLGMYNGTNPQGLHVYSSYTNSSTWQRTSVGFDATDNYAVLRSESSTAGGAPGLGFWINSGLKWVIDAGSNLKPWADEAYNIGSFTASSGVGLRPATVYAAGSATSNSGFELGKFANNSYELCNDTTNGTVLNGLATLTGSGCAVKPASAMTSGVIGVVIANAGTTGTTTLVRTGSAYCSFDATATVIGDYVVASSTANGGSYPLCHDAGTTQPAGVQVLGRVLQATSGGTTAQMFFDMPGSNGQIVPNNASVPWLTVAHAGSTSGNPFSSSAGKASFYGIILQSPKTTSQVTYFVNTADNTANTYDIGIYAGTSGGTCTLMAHIGPLAGTAVAPTAATWMTKSWGPVTLAPGRYYLAITSSATSATFTTAVDNAAFTFTGSAGNVSVTTGGTLDASRTCPTDSYTTSTTFPAWAVN
jgi:hypothetical protein